MALRRPLALIAGLFRELPLGDAIPIEAGGTGVTTAAAARDALAVREKLSAARTYYVRTDGSDNNTGLSNTAGGAFATIQKALTVAGNLDLGTYDLIIQIANGTYTGASTGGATIGSGRVILLGNIANPSSVVLTSSGNTLLFAGFGLYRVQGVKVESTGASGIISGDSCNVEVGNIVCGAVGTFGVHLYANGGLLRVIGSYEIAAGAWYHARATAGGAFRSELAIATTLTGTPAFTGAFMQALFVGQCVYYQATFSGAAAGKRYDATANGVIMSNSAGATYYPGNAAGTISAGGQYL